jgi:HAD superfamily hydrolase (TIGR01549 family)
MSLRAVLFDVDFTLVRPGPELGPEGYRRRGEQFGLRLDPARYEEARAAAVEALERHPELMHDEEIWIEFTERIVRGMGGDGERAHECAVAIERAWEEHGNFDLYEDALPVLERLRGAGLKLGLVSNGVRDLEDFVVHHALDVDVAVCSRAHGRIKPHETIFRAALERLETEPEEAVMVGDSLADDVEGAKALGMRAFLVDRENRYPDISGRLANLYELPAALGLG